MNDIIKKNNQFVQPYSKLIDLDAELSEYKDLCKGEKGNYTYTLWKNDMLEKLKVFKVNELKSKEQIDNFYHYLINQKRVLENENRISLPIMICYTSIAFSCITGVLPNGHIYSIIKVGIVFLTLLCCLKELIINQKNNNLEYCFYCDLIEIVDEMKNDCCSREEQKEI